MLGAVVGEQSIELLLVDGFDVVLRDFGIRSLDFLLLDLSQVFLEVGDVAGSREEHEDVLVDILETAVDVGSELADEFGSHVVLHPEEGEELTQVVDVVE